MKILFYLLCLSSSTGLLSQSIKIDSLKIKLSTSQTKQERLATLSSLNDLLIRQSSMSEATPFFEEMSSLARELSNSTLETRGYLYLSESYMKQMDSIKSFEFAKKAVTIDDKADNTNRYIIDINQLGRAYHHFQYYQKAIDTYNKGIERYDEQSDPKSLKTVAQLYSNSAASYDKLGKKEEGIRAVLKGVAIAEEINEPTQIAYGLYALGYRYMDLENYFKAEKYFLKSLTYADSVALPIYVNMNHHGLGINYSRMKKYNKALYHNHKALSFFRMKGDKLYEFDVLNNTAGVYQRMNVPDSVIKYGNLALTIGKEINNQLAISGARLTLSSAYIKKREYDRALGLLSIAAKDTTDFKVIDDNSRSGIYANFSEIFEGKGEYKKSLKYHKQYKTINDSLSKERYDSKLLDTENQYKSEKKDNKILQQSLEIEESRSRQYLLFGLSGILILALGFTFYLFRRKMNAHNQNKNRLRSEVLRVKQLEATLNILNNRNDDDVRLNNNAFHSFITNTIGIEKDLLKTYLYVVDGKTNREISERMHTSRDNVKKRLGKVYEALKLYDNSDLKKVMSREQSIIIFQRLYLDFVAQS